MEYGGREHLDFAARNYVENVRKEDIGIAGIMYERALRNLIVSMYRHYVDLFRCHSSTAGHRIVLAYNCLEVATRLGHYHRAVRWLQPGEELPDWIPTPEISAWDVRLKYMDAFTLLGDAMHPAYGHPKALAHAYDHVYYEGWEIGNLPLQGKKMVAQSEVVYRVEYSQVLHRFSTLAWIDCEKFIRPMPTSLVHPEMVYPDKRYEAYCLKASDSRPVAQYEPLSDFKMDGLQPRVDLRLGEEVPTYPEDEVDADPRFNEYPLGEEFVEGPEWTPGQIPPKIKSLEYTGSSSDTSVGTQVAHALQTMTVSTEEGPPAGPSTSSTGSDTQKVELTPLPEITQQFAIRMEREIQKQIEERSRKIVHDVLQRSANRLMPPTSSEATCASLMKCFQKAMASPRAKPAAAPEQPKEQPKEPTVQYSLRDLFAGINPPPSEILTGQCQDQPGRGRSTQRMAQPRSVVLPEEKKWRSNSRPHGEADLKRGRSGGTEPSWDSSNVGARRSDAVKSQQAEEPESLDSSSKVKSVVKKVRIKMPELEDLENLGPAAWSRYDKDDRSWRDRSQNRSDSASHKDSYSRLHSGSRKSSQASVQKTQKDEGLGAKLLARKERDKLYKKIVEQPLLYLEERQHQILPEDHDPEVYSLRFFGPGVERAAIEILAMIDWAAEYVKLSRSPVPDIPGYLRCPFVKGKVVKHPIPDDPSESIEKEKCVCTKAQKAWTYFCTLLQFWTDEATTESREVLYGGRRRPANPMIARICAILNPSFGEHFHISWASIAASTSLTQARLYFGEPEKQHFLDEPSPMVDLRNSLEHAVEDCWDRYFQEGIQETPDLSFSTPSWVGSEFGHRPPTGRPEAQRLTEVDSVPPGFTKADRKTTAEYEASACYKTPAESEAEQTIDEELGSQDVVDVDKDWYLPQVTEVAATVRDLLASVQAQPMDVDPPTGERSYQMFDASDVLGLDQGLTSPVTPREDQLLNPPGSFSRAPGDGRPPAGSSGQKITGRASEEKYKFKPG